MCTTRLLFDEVAVAVLALELLASLDEGGLVASVTGVLGHPDGLLLASEAFLLTVEKLFELHGSHGRVVLLHEVAFARGALK